MSVLLAITFIFCLILARFFYIQTVWGDELIMRATDQWNREIPVVASRGKITDRNGQLLAGNRTTYSVFVRPNAVENKEYAATVLSGLFKTDPEELLEKLLAGKVSEITVARQVEKETIEKLTAYNLAGVYYSKDNTRVYSYDDTLCQVLGFTSNDGTGISGLEKYYDYILGGIDGEIMYSTDILGIQTEDSRIVYRQATAGDQIRLTIDIEIQLAAEQAMRAVYESSNAKSVSCIVLDPNNFDVLAMVNYPSYNLNDVPRDDIELLDSLSRNSLVCDIYEPGSTFKVLAAYVPALDTAG
ncbi:MAG: peptidoglycan D,D-transpeptidase FtsI family protein, partial [Candidatus Coproplasma sp.]